MAERPRSGQLQIPINLNSRIQGGLEKALNNQIAVWKGAWKVGRGCLSGRMESLANDGQAAVAQGSAFRRRTRCGVNRAIRTVESTNLGRVRQEMRGRLRHRFPGSLS